MKKKKRTLSVFLTLLLTITLSLGMATNATAEENNALKGNLWVKTSANDFSKGELKGTAITKVGDGEITIDKDNGKYMSEGVYTSEVIYTAPFEYMVLSWNVDAPEGTSVKIEAKALSSNYGNPTWTDWLSWGTWATYQGRASLTRANATDSRNLAYVNTDVLTIRGTAQTASAVRYRLTLKTEDPKKTPVVRLVAGTLRNTLAGQAIPSVYPVNDKTPDLTNLVKEIDVPTYSQYIRDPEIANSICSPTSMTMILNYHGVKLLPEEAAWGVFDDVYDGFGVWPFNTAYASSFGFDSYVRYCESINDLKREVYNGYPAAVSVKYRNSETVNKSYPVVHGAPISYTGGHLIVVVGFTFENGKEYVIVNDSAAASDEEVRRKYLVNEFFAAWSTSGRIAYIVHQGDGGKSAPKRGPGVFKEIKTASTGNQSLREFELKKGNEIIDLSSENVKTIMVSKNGGRYEYIAPTESSTLTFDESIESGKYKFLIIAKGNNIYEASILFK
jgi:hypothetical protein